MGIEKKEKEKEKEKGIQKIWKGEWMGIQKKKIGKVNIDWNSYTF